MGSKNHQHPGRKNYPVGTRDRFSKTGLYLSGLGATTTFQRRANIPRYCHAFRFTGNVGINGGNSGVREGSWDLGVEWFPMLENPVKTQISVFTWTDAIDHGTEMTATRDGVRGKENWMSPSSFYGATPVTH